MPLILLTIALIVAASTAPTQGAAAPAKSISMSVEYALESNKKVVADLFEEGFNNGKIDILPSLVAPDYQGPHGQSGPSSLAKTITDLRATVPDIHYTLDDVVAERDRVVVRWHWEGTQDGPFRGFAASHRHVTSTGMGIFLVEEHKIKRSWLQMDQLSFLQQIGALPEEITPPNPK